LKIVINFAFILCIFYGITFAQKPKIAVYVSEHAGYSREWESVLRSATLNTLVRSNRYEVIERSNVIDAELLRQTSGAIDDDQLTAFGRHLGAQYICVADMTHIGQLNMLYQDIDGTMKQRTRNDYQLSARIVNVETAEIVALGVVQTSILNAPDMSQAMISAVNKMLGTLQPSGDNLPKVAVYVHGGSADSKIGQALYTYTLEALFLNGRSKGDFMVVERSEAFTRQIDREQSMQRSGRIDDRQIARLGKQYGIERIFVADIEYTMGFYNISSRLINIETASVERASDMYHIAKNVEAALSLQIQGREMNDLKEGAVRMVGDITKTQAELEADREARDAKQRRKQKAQAKEKRNGIIIGIVVVVGLIALLAVLPDNSAE